VKSPLFLLPVLALAACATKPVPPPMVDLAAVHCESDLALGGATPVLFDPKNGKMTPGLIDGGAPCLAEKAGTRALYRVFTLPAAADSFVIDVRATPWANTILAPRVLMLDGNGRETRSATRADFTFRGQSLSTLLRSHDDERYLVVLSDSEMLGRTVSRIVEGVQTNMVFTPYAAVAYNTGTDRTNVMTLTPTGRVEVTLTPIKPDGK